MSEWDEAASTYEQHWEKTTGYTVDRLVDILEPAAGKRIADVACGPGTVGVALAALGAQVAASDFSDSMVARVRARAEELGLTALIDAEVANAQSLPYGDDWVDAAVSNFGIIFCPDIAAALREFVRVTRPGGRLAMTAWTTEERNGWTTLLGADKGASLGFALPERPAYRWSSEEEFAAGLRASGWRDIAIDTIDFPPHILPSAEHAGSALDSPATRIGLRVMREADVAALRAHLVERARTLYGDGEVPLPRQAWLARATA